MDQSDRRDQRRNFIPSAVEQSCDWSVEERGRGFVNPKCLDGGEDFLLVASQGDAHSEQVSVERNVDYGRRKLLNEPLQLLLWLKDCEAPEEKSATP